MNFGSILPINVKGNGETTDEIIFPYNFSFISKPMNFTAILFDLDGTLIDSAPDLVGVTNRLREKENLAPLPYSLLRSYVSDGATGLIKRSFGEEQPAELLTERRDAFLTDYGMNPLRHGTKLFANMEQLPEILQTVRWGIVTNKNRPLTEALFDSIPLLQQARVVVCGGDTDELKPHPGPVLYACEKLGVAASDTLFVGDNVKDIEAGHRAGAATMAVLYGYHHTDDNPQEWGADYYISSPEQLLVKLRELLSL